MSQSRRSLRLSRHEAHEDVLHATRQFLANLRQEHTRFSWLGSRSYDSVRLETDIRHMHLYIVHTVPACNADFIEPPGSVGMRTGKRKEEIYMHLEDRALRFGLRFPFKEWFMPRSPLFVEAQALFREIQEHVEIVIPWVDVERPPYAHVVDAAAKAMLL